MFGVAVAMERMGSVMRVVQVGLGIWGRSWADVVRDSGRAELAAVVDPAPEAQLFAEEELGLPPESRHASLDEALEKTECDCVLVVTPPGTHYAVIMEALGAGKHVLVEKPHDTTLSGARALVEAAGRASRILMVSQIYRFNAPFRAAQGLVRSGVLGELASIRIGCRRDTRVLFPPDDFRYSMRHPYALDMAIHHLDLLRAMTGREVRRIDGRSWRAPDSPFGHHPNVAALIDLDDGTPVVYEGTWAQRGPETSWNGDWEVVGEAALLTWRGATEDRNVGEVILQRWGEPARAVEQPRLDLTQRAAVLQALIAAIESGEEPETGASDNLGSLAAMLGLVESIESGAPVEIGKVTETAS
ncbi:MAG: Gfo/Idh/MocA family oxidoreductase [Actinomycetota bacterium]|nr:Gfo/Idh/MocA family oxidoreductase [Actinomycetota bacterium]